MDEFLHKITPDRRSFIQRVVAMAAFAVPTVRSFVMATAATAVLEPLLGRTTGVPTTSPSTTHVPTSHMPTTTTSAPTTPPPHHHGVPEIDPTSAGTALTILAGAVLIARDRHRSKEVVELDKKESDLEKQS